MILTIQKHSSSNVNPKMFSDGLVEQGFASLRVGASKNEASIVADGIIPGGRDGEKFVSRGEGKRNTQTSCLLLSCVPA